MSLEKRYRLTSVAPLHQLLHPTASKLSFGTFEDLQLGEGKEEMEHLVDPNYAN